ncbi:MAG: acylphosphatase [Gammaproteobacteria bacterium]|nr:acylphosphatase [Gammaproteobacteria bacterium]
MICRHYWVKGRVQGVFYRTSARDQAQQLGLSGWVKNLDDGRVEALACGTEQQLVQFELWLQQGPPMSRVDTVEVKDEPGHPSVKDFQVSY